MDHYYPMKWLPSCKVHKSTIACAFWTLADLFFSTCDSKELVCESSPCSVMFSKWRAHYRCSVKYLINKSGLVFMQKYATLISISSIIPEKKILGFHIPRNYLTAHLNAMQFKYFSFSLSFIQLSSKYQRKSHFSSWLLLLWAKLSHLLSSSSEVQLFNIFTL